MTDLQRSAILAAEQRLARLHELHAIPPRDRTIDQIGLMAYLAATLRRDAHLYRAD